MTDDSTDELRIKREKADGRFKAGNAGRPRGSRGKAAALAEKLAAKDISEIVNVLVEAAKAGDVQSAALLLARLWPPPKGGRTVSFDLPPITSAACVDGHCTKPYEHTGVEDCTCGEMIFSYVNDFVGYRSDEDAKAAEASLYAVVPTKKRD
jgi:hypothetical protein